ncbi:MAG: hypothetical protein KC486_28140, partial [Myxococcales bacterium]|nr:hypothetical protein [Myxococcales bacterium]
EWFDPVVVPRKIKILDRLPREANGKLRRQRLLEVLGLAAKKEASPAPPPPPSLITYRLRRTFPPERSFVVRSHSVHRCADREVHEILVEVPREVDDVVGPGPAVARMLSQVICRVAGLGRPQRMQGAGLRQAVSAGEALLLRLEVERRHRRVHFALVREGQRCTEGIVDYAGADELREAQVG